MVTNSIGVRFTDLNKFKLMLPYLIVDKGSIESLSANDCILIQQPFAKQTVFTVIDPSRAKIKLIFNHNTLDDSGGVNTNNETHEEFYWNILLHFPDFMEKVSRVFKSNIISCFITNHKTGYGLKNISNTGSSSSLSLKCYPGSVSDFKGPEEGTIEIIKINSNELLNSLKIANFFSESSREKRGTSVTSSKQLLIDINYIDNELYVIAPSKNQLSCIKTKVNFIPFTLDNELVETYSSFCIEARFIKQLIYICNGASVTLLVPQEASNQWITFRSDVGEITLLKSKPSINYRDSSLLFTDNNSIEVNNQTFPYETKYNRALSTEDLLNAASLLQPSKTEIFINRLILLENKDEISVLPSNDISAKDIVSFKYLFKKDAEFISFLILGNLLIHSLKTMNLISRYYKQNNSTFLLTVKELITPRGSTLNLFIKCVIVEEIAGQAVIRVDNMFDMWISIDKVSQNMDLVNIDD